MSVAVITATTGSPLLANAVASVTNQTYPRVEHWLVVDGQEYVERTKAAVGEHAHVRVIILPENTGGPLAGNFVCHRIYAAAPWLVGTDYICYLDEDNEFEPWHVEKLVKALGMNKWAHSLRSIVSQDGTVIGIDACESLGGIRHSVLSQDDFFVDTNCYLLETQLARNLSPCWNVPARPTTGQLEADRAVCRTLMSSRLFPGISRTPSVRYRVSGRENSVTASFFERGNARTRFDPEKPDVYLLHFTQSATRAFLDPDGEIDPLAEWAPSMWVGLHDEYNVLDGYANAPIIPSGATVLATVWHPSALPLDLLKRTDIKRILFMVESPNIRHADQFKREFLDAHADIVLTYWTDLLVSLGPEMGVWCPMNTHPLDLRLPQHRERALRQNKGKGRSVAIVLERRSLGGSYDIDGITLQCLDGLRETYVRGMKDVHCYGKGWDKVPGVTVMHTLGSMDDPRHSIDILEHYSFALIIENCDAEGYASEKLYDCLCAGCIPLYYGSPPSQLQHLLEGMYVDLHSFETGTDVQTYLENLHPEEIYHMKARISKKREALLDAVGIQTYANIFFRL